MDNFMWLEEPIHMNRIKFEISDDVKSKLMLSYDGTIMAVDKDLVSGCFDSEESLMVRLGQANIPKSFKINDEESFIKYMSYQRYSE